MMQRSKNILLTLVLTTATAAAGAMSRFYDSNQMSSNLVTGICQDGKGFIWISTEYGLNKFDGIHFTQYYDDTPSPSPLAGNNIRMVKTDSRGDVWVLSSGSVQRYDYQTNSFATADLGGRAKDLVDLMQKDGHTMWVLDSQSGIIPIDMNTLKVLPQAAPGTPPNARSIFLDGRQRLWTTTGDAGIEVRDLRTGGRQRFFGNDGNSKSVVGTAEHKGTVYVVCRSGLFRYGSRRLTKVMPFSKELGIRRVQDDSRGGILICTHNGVFRIDTGRKGTAPVFSREADGIDLAGRDINTVLEDRLGNIWIGCVNKGVAFLSKQSHPFSFFSLDRAEFSSGGILRCAVTLPNGHWLLGQNGNGLTETDPQGTVYNRWLGKRTVTCLLPCGGGADSRVWVGTYYNGLGTLDMRTGGYTPAQALAGKYVKGIATDRRGNIYAAGFNEGLRSLTPDGKEERVLCGGRMELHDKYVNYIMRDSRNRIWIGHYYGFDIYDAERDRTVDTGMPEELRSATTYCITEGRDGTMWLGTNHGLWRLDRSAAGKAGTWRQYTKKEGMPDNMVCGIVEAADGSLWIGTFRGLCQLDKKTGRIVGYYKGNGLEQLTYARGVCGTMPGGTVFMGNDNGITSFKPALIDNAPFSNGVVLTGLFTADMQLPAGDEFSMDYSDNTFTLRFSTMDFREPESIYYEYRFTDGQKDVWHKTAAGISEITLTHLSPGRHLLLVRAVQGSIVSEAKKITIHILPPWYRSWWAYTLYALILSAGTAAAWHYRKKRLQADTNEAKIRFFIDVSHELRSPLTLIKSPLDNLLKKEDDPQRRRALLTIRRNTDRLLSLVNEILSIRRIEKGQKTLHFSETDFSQIIANVFNNFTYAAEKRKITFTLTGAEKPLMLWVDRNDIQKVIYNLISNAMKYVSDGGEININVRREEQADGSGGYVEVSVADNGTGIDEKHLKHVFERFYQAPARPAAGQLGYGIGLNLTYKIVTMHGGSIKAHNRTDTEHGSEFIIRIPTGNKHLPKGSIVDESYWQTAAGTEEGSTARTPQPEEKAAGERTRRVRHKTSYRVFVVDDDEEIRRFLSEELGATYIVSTFPDGAKALEAAAHQAPDLVISDIKMPGMDGFTLLHRLKNSTATSHVPVILLTSKAEHTSRVEGLEEGADAYINKPFSLDELEAHIAGLIANRMRMKGKFSGVQQQEDTINGVELKGNDAQLMERIMKSVNERLYDSDFNVEALADDIGMSRVQLHRRVKEMTGITVGEFLRNLRLQQAARLLEKGDVTISQVTYAIGMANPTHFTTTFKKYFGVTPTEYMAKHSGTKQNGGYDETNRKPALNK